MASSAALPSLKLVIEKGPRKGDTREFDPTSTVKIGRVVRGNNLPIKDAGISSKHLSIQFSSDSCKWVITDLDSSNGTILNSSQIKALSPFVLSSGDEIKIGESTSIRVEIVETGGDISHYRNLRRRAPPKGGIDSGDRVEVVDLDSPNWGEDDLARVRDLKSEDLLKGVDSKPNSTRETRSRRGRGRPKKEIALADGNSETDVVNVAIHVNEEDVRPKQERGVSTRRTRNSKREDEKFMSLGDSIPARRTRNTRNVEGTSNNEVSLNGGSCKEVEIVAESKKPRGRGRRKKVDVECSSNANDVVLEDTTIRDSSLREVLDVSAQQDELLGDTVQQDVPQMLVPNVEKIITNDSEPEVQEQVKCVPDVKQPCEKEQSGEETVRVIDTGVGASHLDQGMHHNLESDKVSEDGGGRETEMEEVSEELDTEADGEEEHQEAGNMPDLEKMSLGEWFDFLEVYLPKQIYAARDEVIEEMRKRAKQFDDFMFQQQSERGPLPKTT